MQNFLKNVTNTINIVQEVRREFTGNQQAAARRRLSESRSRSGSPPPVNDEPELETFDTRSFVRFDKDTGFTVFHNPANDLFYVIYLDSGLCALKTSGLEEANTQRDLLNQHQLVAESAHQHKLLSRFVAQVAKTPNWADIHLACAVGLPDLIDKLCEKDALLAINLPTPDEGLLPIHISIVHKNLPVTKQLLAYGADLRKCDANIKNCVHYAAKNDLRFLKELYKLKQDQFRECLVRRDGLGFNPYHYSLQSHSSDVAKFLIKCGADSSLVGIDLRELHVSLTCLQAVLKVDPDALVGNPITPYTTIFHYEFDREYIRVAHEGNPKIVNHPNPDGRTPLHMAVLRNDLDTALDLLSFGADVNIAGKAGNTPLNLATQKGHEELVKLLLCFDADYNKKNKEGQSPLDIKSTDGIAKLFSEIVKSKRMAEESEIGHEFPASIRSKQNRAIEHQYNLDEETRNQSLRLLSFDGGGIRGLCLVILLIRIERHIRGGKIGNYFDWIAGTSTGAILALALAMGSSTSECLQYYLRLKDEVFIGTRPHSAKPLEDFFKKRFGENTTMDKIKKKVMVTTTRANTNPPKLVLIRSYEMEQVNTVALKPSKIEIWKAARCSSAAPTYFPSVDNTYLDGGLMANNPVADLLSDVHNFNSQREDKGEDPIPMACLLSIGTGRLPEQPMTKLDVELPNGFNLGSLFTDLSTTLESIMNLKNLFVEQLAISDGPVIDRSMAWAHALNVPFFRYTPQLQAECPLNTKDNHEIINLMWTAKLYAESRSQGEIEQIIRLIRAEPL